MSEWIKWLLLSVAVLGMFGGFIWLFIFSPWGELAAHRDFDDREEFHRGGGL